MPSWTTRYGVPVQCHVVVGEPPLCKGAEAKVGKGWQVVNMQQWKLHFEKT